MTTNGGLEATWDTAVPDAAAHPPPPREPTRLEPHERRTLDAIQERLRGGDRVRPPDAGPSAHDRRAFAGRIPRASGKAEARAVLALPDGVLDGHVGRPRDPGAP